MIPARHLLVSALLAAAVMACGSCRGGGAATTDGGSSVTSGSGGAATGGGTGAGGGLAGGGGASPGTDANEWANWPMPNPVSTGLPNPESYDTTTFGMVKDNVTGLTWQQSLDSGAFTWQGAYAYCDDLVLGGTDDWRLPTLIELVSIVDFTQLHPAIDALAFPDAVQGNFWTATPVAGSPGEAWYVAFSTGFSYQGHQEFLTIGVRCVRATGGATGANSDRYTFPSASAVFDTRTGLTWQRTTDAATTYSWPDAEAYCQALDLDGAGWRLPSMKELQTLVDVGRQIPALDPSAFPDAPVEQYWTSSSLAGSDTQAWSVGFRLGASTPTSVDSLGFVRCCR
jgi:hypothetical protein